MPLFQLTIIAIIQGITEFLPISSSGHLVLLPQLTGARDQGLAIDVAVHVGTLGAVILYFWRDVGHAARGAGRLLRGQMTGRQSALALCLIVATLPAVIAGLAIKLAGADAALRSVAVIGWATLIFGLVLWVADRYGPQTRPAESWTLRHAFWMGLAQALALIPGTSRSGIAITAARALGYGRADAARLSMLMSIPVILASAVVLSADVVAHANWALARDAAIAAVLAFLAALAALAAMFRLLRRISFTPYVIYRIGLGFVLLVWAYGLPV